MTSDRTIHDALTRAGAARLPRRRFAQALAAAPLVAAAGGRLAVPARAQEKTQIKFWTHTHPPMVDQNKAMTQIDHQSRQLFLGWQSSVS